MDSIRNIQVYPIKAVLEDGIQQSRGNKSNFRKYLHQIYGNISPHIAIAYTSGLPLLPMNPKVVGDYFFSVETLN